MLEFKEEATASDYAIKASALSKGALCVSVSSRLSRMLEDSGFETHFLDHDGFRGITMKVFKIIAIYHQLLM
ncbi:phosphoribosylaminoimidazole-succinocarboxamide synthase [Desulfurococcaceae archaeon AG1]|nr:phosphoribosylaminoimidazole-succinocarboxamide synthase [Desulfurococcaceae archaeon AG1]